jgi:hypothetical protein
MKGGSEKIVSIGGWGAAAMIRNFSDIYRGLAIAVFKVPQPPMPNQTPNPPSCQALITHHKCKADTPYFDRSSTRQLFGDWTQILLVSCPVSITGNIS